MTTQTAAFAVWLIEFGVGLAAWVLVGLFAGYFWQREGQRTAQAETA